MPRTTSDATTNVAGLIRVVLEHVAYAGSPDKSSAERDAKARRRVAAAPYWTNERMRADAVALLLGTIRVINREAFSL